jgi:hypothetical protein
MYASAMKFCGAMELCGIGYPRGETYDHQWPDVEAQVAAQKAGLIVSITRDRDEQEAQLMRDKGFAPVYQFTNPRTGNPATLWIKDMTGKGGPVTKLPENVPPPPTSLAEYSARIDAVLAEISQPRVYTGWIPVAQDNVVAYTGPVASTSSPEDAAGR